MPESPVLPARATSPGARHTCAHFEVAAIDSDARFWGRLGGERALHLVFTISLILAALALVGVFIEIPVVSNYAFWVLMAAYVLLAGNR
jgi:hypothetical protein